MPFLRRCRGFFMTVRAYIPVGFEIGLCVLSFYAAFLLISDQTYFDRNERAYRWLMGISTHEWIWGSLALFAATMKTIGFYGFFVRSETAIEYAFLIRAVGWGGSFAFWTLLGTTFLMWNPSISSGATLLLGLFSLGMVLAGPILPERDDG